MTQTKVRTRVGTAVLGAAIIIAAAAGLVIKNQDTGLDVGGGYDFGKVMTKETAVKVFVLQNTETAGDYKLGITPLVGAFAINQESSTCQAILAAGQSCKLAVKFTPTEAIKHKATLSIRYIFNGKTKGAAVKLQGEGVSSATDTACLDSDVTDKNFAGMPMNVYKFVNVFKLGHIKGLSPTTGVFMEADDKCWNEKRVLEYYCDSKTGKVSWNSYDCPGGCADGACQEVVCPTAPTNAKGLSVNGVCSWECVSPWENKDGKEENGCECNVETKQGCPVSQCYDSDGGIVLEKMGMAQGLNPKTNVMEVLTDFCSSVFQVVEYACQGDYLMVDSQAPGEPPLSSAGTFCPKGTYCKDSACQPCQKKNLGYTSCQNFGGKYYAAEMVLGDDCSIYATNSVDGIKLCGDTADSCVDGVCVAKPDQVSFHNVAGFPDSQILIPGLGKGMGAFTYTVLNSSGKNIKINQIKFFLNATAAAKAGLSDWKLKINDLSAGKGDVVGDSVVFDNVNSSMTDTGTNVMKVYANIKGPLSVKEVVQLQIKSADQVTVVNADNGKPMEVVGAFPLSAPALVGDQPEVLAAVGALKVEYAGDNPVPAQLLAGTTGNELIRYKMTALEEDVSVTALPLYYTGNVDYVAAVKLFLDGKQVGESDGYTLTSAKHTVKFADGAFVLKKDVTALLSIKIDFKDKDVLKTSTMPLKIGLADGDGDYSDWDGKPEGYYSISAVGLSSGLPLDQTKIDGLGDGAGGVFGSNPFTLHRGLLKVSLDSGSAGGTAKPGLGSDLLKIKLAAVGDDIEVNDIEFVANGTCKPKGSTGTYLRSNDLLVTYAEWDSANSLNGEMPRAWSVSVNEKNQAWNESLIIAAGETKVLRLTGETTGCKTNEFLSVSVSSPSSGAATKAGIEYQDSSGVNIDMKTTKNLPVNGNALIY